jgi:hypothetical protein
MRLTRQPGIQRLAMSGTTCTRPARSSSSAGQPARPPRSARMRRFSSSMPFQVARTSLTLPRGPSACSIAPRNCDSANWKAIHKPTAMPAATMRARVRRRRDMAQDCAAR